MRVFAKKSFEFKLTGNKDGRQVVAEKVTTSPLSFCDLPDWVVQDPLFHWARKDGDIELIQSKAEERLAELTAAAMTKPGPKKEKIISINSESNTTEKPEATTGTNTGEVPENKGTGSNPVGQKENTEGAGTAPDKKTEDTGSGENKAAEASNQKAGGQKPDAKNTKK
jgi:hypothetical protein